jgi:hypothetical protein
MLADSAGANVHLSSDFFAGKTGTDKAQNLQLAGPEYRNGG